MLKLDEKLLTSELFSQTLRNIHLAGDDEYKDELRKAIYLIEYICEQSNKGNYMVYANFEITNEKCISLVTIALHVMGYEYSYSLPNGEEYGDMRDDCHVYTQTPLSMIGSEFLTRKAYPFNFEDEEYGLPLLDKSDTFLIRSYAKIGDEVSYTVANTSYGIYSSSFQISEDDLIELTDCFSNDDIYVNVYQVTRHYGGAEEGGWYYDRKECVKSQKVAINEANELVEKFSEMYLSEGDISSVLGGFEYHIEIEVSKAESECLGRPTYE